MRNLSYDPAADFTVVGVFRSSGSYLMVRPQAPWRDLASFIAAAKAEPKKLTFGYFNASSRTPPEYSYTTCAVGDGAVYLVGGAPAPNVYGGAPLASAPSPHLQRVPI